VHCDVGQIFEILASYELLTISISMGVPY
jgi:hypothetical protein